MAKPLRGRSLVNDALFLFFIRQVYFIKVDRHSR